MKFVCANCGKLFSKPRHKESKHKFCSRECYNEFRIKHDWYRKMRYSKVKNIGTSDNFLRKYLKPLLPKHCEVCGTTEKLEIHHKDGNRRNNKLSNLMVVCRSCHRRIDNRIRNIPKEKMGTGKSYYLYKEIYEAHRLPNGRWGKWS